MCACWPGPSRDTFQVLLLFLLRLVIPPKSSPLQYYTLLTVWLLASLCNLFRSFLLKITIQTGIGETSIHNHYLNHGDSFFFPLLVPKFWRFWTRLVLNLWFLFIFSLSKYLLGEYSTYLPVLPTYTESIFFMYENLAKIDHFFNYGHVSWNLIFRMFSANGCLILIGPAWDRPKFEYSYFISIYKSNRYFLFSSSTGQLTHNYKIEKPSACNSA